MSTKDDTFVRSQNHGCFRIEDSPAWGRYLVPIDDPEGTPLSEEELTGIQIIDNFPRVKKEVWARIISLYFYLCDDKKEKIKFQSSELEVSVLFLRKEDDLSTWRVVVPSQVVTETAVQANFEKSCDIVTGEELEGFPPTGWIHCGSSHSHNTMEAFFSSVDDKNELGVPGLHIVIGKINKKKMTYNYEASIVLKKQRKFVDIDKVVDTKALALKFHPKVLEYITVAKPKNKKSFKKFFGFKQFLENSNSNESESSNEKDEDILFMRELLSDTQNIFEETSNSVDGDSKSSDDILLDELKDQIRED